MNSREQQNSQLKTIVTLFVILRVTILLLYTPQGLFNAYTDYQHYYRTAQLSEMGRYPFINAWYEYPPIATYLSEGVYGLMRSLLPPGDLTSFTYQLYSRLLAVVFLIFETGVLILLHRIAARLWDNERADWLGWVYSVLSLPLFFWNMSQNSVTAFFTLLAIERFIHLRWRTSAVALGLGIATKFTPVFLLAPAVKFLWPDRKNALLYGAITVLTIAAIFVPFFVLGGGPWVVASFVVLARLGSWSTPWALIDGNWSGGDAGPLETRLQLDAINHLPGNPAVIPGFLTLIVFGLLYLWIFLRPIDRRNPRHFVWFSTLTAIIFILWSKGWSPNWVTLIIPLILLSFPNQRGLWLVLALTGIVFAEWPLSDAFRSRPLFVIAILARTALFIAVALMTARHLWPSNKKASEALATSEA